MSAAKAIIAGLEAVTKDWARQRKAEERSNRAYFARQDRLIRARQLTIVEAAYAVMPEAYKKASGDGKLPTKARQVMYAARPYILASTGRDTLNDAYFTQTLLPNYIEEHSKYCATWDIVWDARGHFVEPHTGRTVPLGTLEVRRYLALATEPQPPNPKTVPDLQIRREYSTIGPRNRFKNVLFIEKEGFDPIFAAARLQERFDITLMSTKGMSVTAARMLLDRLAPEMENIFVLHDFDIAGFSIFGTLGTDGRRYRFANPLNLIDLGLRLVDVDAMGLESEPVQSVSQGEWAKRRITLSRHGATSAEIDLLRSRRVELNAMTSPQLIAFVEAALRRHGVAKFVPDMGVIAKHARSLVSQQSLAEVVREKRDEIADRVMRMEMPEDLPDRLRAALEQDPERSWDEALARIYGGNRNDDTGKS